MRTEICKLIDSCQHQIKLKLCCCCIVCVAGILCCKNICQVDDAFPQTSVVVINAELQFLAHVRHQQKVRCVFPQVQAMIEDIIMAL